jgi:hypothetical protein
MTSYKVTSPLVIVKQTNDRYVHVYEGGFLPSDADEEHVQQLVEGGLVEEADLPSEPEAETAPKRSRGK